MITKTKTELPEFTGVVLMPPEYKNVFPQADFLKGSFGEAVLGEFYEQVASKYNDNDNLYALALKDSPIEGSIKTFQKWFGKNFQKNSSYQHVPD